jgi:GNAT superfamily N-acetyltransferase
VLCRVRTTMADRPGSLASLAQRCGEQGVNILGLQIFPEVAGVTDELVLRVPDDWATADVETLVASAGGADVSVDRCTEHALVDGPIQYLHALRRVAHDPGTLTEMLCRLLDADVSGVDSAGGPDTLTVEVATSRVTVRRAAPFTPTEHARAVAFAEVAAELVGTSAYPAAHRPLPGASPEPVVRLASVADAEAVVRMHLRCSADTTYRRYAAPLARVDERFARRQLASGGGALVATVGDEVVGLASLSDSEDSATEVSVLVEDAWQRRGLGARLLSSAARLARGRGATEVVLRSPTHNPALIPLAFASGMRARIRLDGQAVVVTVGIDGLKPLTTAPAPRPALA